MAHDLWELELQKLTWESESFAWEASEVSVDDFVAKDILNGKPVVEECFQIWFLPRIEDFKGADDLTDAISEAYHIDTAFWTLHEKDIYFQGNANPIKAAERGPTDWSMTHMSRFVIPDPRKKGTVHTYHEHSLTFFSLWLSEYNRGAYSHFILCFGLNDQMRSSIIKDLKQTNGRLVSGSAFEVYGVLAKVINRYAGEATRRLDGAIFDFKMDQPSTGPWRPNPYTRSGELLEKYQKMSELLNDIIKTRESLSATKKTLSSVSQYAEKFMTRWSPEAQEDLDESIETLIALSKTTREIEKKAGSSKRRLDLEMTRLHQLIVAENTTAARNISSIEIYANKQMTMTAIMMVALFLVGMYKLAQSS